MSFKAIKIVFLLALTALLSACGGGGGGGNDSGFTPPGSKMTATAQSNSVAAGGSTDISVRFTDASGNPVSDGRVVTASVSPASVGNVFGVDASGGTTQAQTATTTGGNANFRFVGQSQGTAVVSFSAADPNAGGRTVSASVTISVAAGPGRLSIEATRDTLPVNAFNVEPFIGSPYMTELTITVRDSAGNLVNQEDGVAVSVNPVGNTGGFSTLDDGSTANVNEFQVRLGQGPVDVVAGKATVFLHSLNFAGTTTVTVSHQGEDGQRFEATRTFTIVSDLPPLPAEVAISEPVRPIYIASSGGNSSGQISIAVRDGIGEPVPDPEAGNNAFNNVRVEIVGDDLGARLTGTNAAGQTVSGNSIAVRSINGIVSISVSGAERAGQLQLRATADQADNNVDNGVQSGVSGTRTIVISDGVLFDLQITQPIASSLFVNPFDSEVAPPSDGSPALPPAPDGTYSRTVSVIASDRLGNPVLPGTVINFGLIDEPQATGAGDFLHRGNDGRPQVNGVAFTAGSGRFVSRGGGVGPGDTLVVFGKRESELPFGLSPPPEGYRDLESARQIDRVLSETSLEVVRPFNANDDSGASVPVPSPGVLPWVIGRAADGNITATATTNELGVATVRMNYPTSRLGKIVVVWAQGLGPVAGGQPETVTDAQTAAFSALAPATLTASPGQIPANTTAEVLVCVSDALRSPVANVAIDGGFSNFDGNGSITFSGTGPASNLTDESGCVVAVVTTSGVAEGEAQVVFTGAGAQAFVDIVRGNLVLQATPSVLFGSGTITLSLINGQGEPQSGYQLLGTCAGADGATLQITSGPGVTNASGETTVSVLASDLNQVGSAGSGTCTFSTADGSATTTVRFEGTDLCTLGFSPPPEGCPAP